MPAELYPSYEWSGRTIKYHRVQIREYLGFREATVQDGHELVDWLVTQVLPNEHREDHVREAVFERCRAQRSSRRRLAASIGLSVRRLMRSRSAGAPPFSSGLGPQPNGLDELLVTGGADE